MNEIGWLLVFVSTFGAAGLAVPKVISLLAAGGAVRRNFLGSEIPVGGGAVFPLVLFPGTVLLAWFGMVSVGGAELFLLVLLAGWGVGVFDDWLGNRGPKGWAGHFGSLRRGRISTGMVKVLFGGLLGLWASEHLGREGPVMLLDAAVFGLAMNSVNLFDVRPGRAVIYFLAALGLTAGFRVSFEGEKLLMMSAAAALAFLPWDRAVRVMLGDSGANALGAVLGLGLAVSEPPMIRVWAALFLVVLQLVGERYSIGRFLDRFGNSEE